MSTKNNTNEWVCAYASVIGNGHIANDLPCQDSCDHERINDIWSVAVVSDGAGSAKESHQGSDFVARNTAHCLHEVINRNSWNTAEEMPDEKAWRSEALKALQIVRQRLEKFSEANEIPPADLACTVLAALYSPFGLLTCHIGDGRAAYSTKKGEWLALIEPFRGNEVNETVFITSNIWTTEGVDAYIQTGIIKEEVRGFSLMSDGCEKGSFEVNVLDEETGKYHDPNRPFNRFFEPNLQGMLKLGEEEKTQDEINELWAGFLKEGNQQFKRETDDKTMILCVRVPTENS